MEDASSPSGPQVSRLKPPRLASTASGGGYELALACDEILLVDDASSAVSLPEVALLAVLPGTGGLTQVVDKRKVRRDLADDLLRHAGEGIKGEGVAAGVAFQSIEAVPRSQFDQAVAARAKALAPANRQQSTPEAWHRARAADSRFLITRADQYRFVAAPRRD